MTAVLNEMRHVPVITWINTGRVGCKGNTRTDRKDGLLTTTCDSCRLRWTMTVAPR